MDPRLLGLSDILRLNTKLFRNCLEGMTEEQAQKRPSPSGNNAAFVALHLADSRFFLLRALGADLPNPLAPFVDGVRTLADVTVWPSLDEIRSAWTTASRALRERLEGITAAELDGPPVLKAPGESTFGALLFMVQHDCYHVGQLSLLRSQAGLPAMSYR
jgi:uncharacterized damage-inducible protein DinB